MMIRPTALLLAASLAFASAAHAADTPDAAALLRPYYTQLARDIALPQAPPTPQASRAAPLHRLAFGSCLNQELDQQIWGRIAATNPQLFLMIGDNVYGDIGWEGDASLGSLRAAYARLAAREEFAAFRRAVPMLTVWDDHDFGFNDGGAAFAFREWAETIHETFWNAAPAIRNRPGVYDSAIHGPEGRRVQVILLDTRFFRSAIASRSPFSGPAPLGRHIPNLDPAATMLGDAQWRWLASELARPAELRIIVSSIQVLSDAHDHEGWKQLPHERERLFGALKARAGGGLLLLSGDRHRGAIYRATPLALGEEIAEFTSSSLNLPFKPGDRTAEEPDPARITGLTGDENFGLIDIDWDQRALVLSLLDKDGRTREQQRISWRAPAQAADVSSIPRSPSLR